MSYREAQWQKLPQPMVAGQEYNSSVALAVPKFIKNDCYTWTDATYSNTWKTCWPVQLEIWGSDSPPGCYRSFGEIEEQEAEEAAMGEDAVADLESNLDSQIAELENPTTETITLGE